MKLDFSSFYKFISSVGLLLMAASILLPWFVLRAHAPEAPPATPAAGFVEVALDQRASQYLFIVQAYPWVSLSLFVLGLVFTGTGLILWFKRQKKFDTDEDVQYEQRVSLGVTTKASNEDQASKLDEDDQVDGEDGELGGRAPVGTAGMAQDTDEDPTRRLVDDARDSVRRARFAFISEAEGKVGMLLSEAFEETHTIESNVRIGEHDEPILDFVARATDPDRWTSFAVDLKVMRPQLSFRGRMRDSMLSVALAARGVPEGKIQVGTIGRPPSARSVSICFVIVDDVAHEERRVAGDGALRVRHDTGLVAEIATRDVNTVLSRKVGVVFTRRSVLDEVEARAVRSAVLGALRWPSKIADISS